LGLTEHVQTILNRGEQHLLPTLLSSPTDDPVWENQRRILAEEFGFQDVASALRRLPAMATDVATAVERSKAKDDVRGPRIIADYGEVHTPAARDAVVCQTWEETATLQGDIERLLAHLQGNATEGKRNGRRTGTRKAPSIPIAEKVLEGSPFPA